MINIQSQSPPLKTIHSHQIFKDLEESINQFKYPQFDYPPILYEFKKDSWQKLANGILEPSLNGLYVNKFCDYRVSMKRKNFFKLLRSPIITSPQDTHPTPTPKVNSHKRSQSVSRRSSLKNQRSISQPYMRSSFGRSKSISHSAAKLNKNQTSRISTFKEESKIKLPSLGKITRNSYPLKSQRSNQKMRKPNHVITGPNPEMTFHQKQKQIKALETLKKMLAAQKHNSQKIAGLKNYKSRSKSPPKITYFDFRPNFDKRSPVKAFQPASTIDSIFEMADTSDTMQLLQKMKIDNSKAKVDKNNGQKEGLYQRRKTNILLRKVSSSQRILNNSNSSDNEEDLENAKFIKETADKFKIIKKILSQELNSNQNEKKSTDNSSELVQKLKKNRSMTLSTIGTAKIYLKSNKKILKLSKPAGNQFITSENAPIKKILDIQEDQKKKMLSSAINEHDNENPFIGQKIVSRNIQLHSKTLTNDIFI